MGIPLLDLVDVAPLQEIAEAGLVHTVILETEQRVRQPGGVYVTTWVAEAAQDGLLTPASAGGTNIKADQPSAAGDWTLTLRAGQVIAAGQRALVKGYVENDKAKAVLWQRLVHVERVLFPQMAEVYREALCTDVATNP